MARVLVTGFCAVPGPRRSGVQLRHVVRALTSMHTVDLLVAREGDQAYVERQGAVRVLRVPLGDGDVDAQSASFQRALRRQLDGAEYDVIHCVDPWSAEVVLELKDRLEVLVVYDAARSPQLNAAGQSLAFHVMARADLVLLPDAATAALYVQALAELGRVPPLHVSPIGVDVDRFDWDPDPSDTDVAKLVVVGQLHHGIGLETAIAGLALCATQPPPQLLLAGDIEEAYQAALHAQATALGIADRVQFLGVVDHEQVPALLAGARICVVPGPSAAATGQLPTKLMEYWACRRLALVATSAVPDGIVVADGDVVLFVANDAANFAGHVDSLLADRERCARIAQQGYQRVRDTATASAARREVRIAYSVLGQAYAAVAVQAARTSTASEDSVRLDVGIEDDFDVTVFEQAPAKPTAAPAPLDVRVVAGEIGDVRGPDEDLSTGALQLDDVEVADDLEEIFDQDLIEAPRAPVRLSTPPPFRSRAMATVADDAEPAATHRGLGYGTDADTGEVSN
jgi:glycosyltransferase involved in cell wall biosynthesis